MKVLAALSCLVVPYTAIATNSTNNKNQPSVLGGTEVPIGDKTYATSIRETPGDPGFCGGSLITSKHVLTAAHCSKRIRYVSVGTHYLSGTSDGHQLAVVKKMIHPNRHGDSWDFLVLELEREVDDVAPVALASADDSDVVPGEMATVLGWGYTTPGGDLSDVLLSLDVQLLSNDECSRAWDGAFDESMVCAGGQYMQNSCKGDSGGPLIVSKGGRDVLVGVVSFGPESCGIAGIPVVYGRVSMAREWIDRVAPGVNWR